MTWDQFKRGYLRFALGWCQMGFSASAMVALLIWGLDYTTWALVAFATLATALSRWLYSSPPTNNRSPRSDHVRHH